ncbi:Thiol-disulfide oxidoreductase ResA [Poriferisphaera corsica]|uniref:Thiol-disulfide oxidoreductase ResA n=1 Tax=Poriferisphaera corsica TaxID=2528020 RepID=A0A517YZE2_9BACT|nr:carboxypeptidase regulatory-like domain-containing protein [Poriferisphaera corsica]QDU35610.1 Thiol-disulfide oxidoreductase ResA [Poriferisphaera corsica]
MRTVIATIGLILMAMVGLGCKGQLIDFGLDQTPPEEKIVVNTMAEWRVAPQRTGNVYTTAHAVENRVDKVVFRVNQTGSRVAWELPLGQVIDINQYPILTLKYRSSSPGFYDVWSLYGNNVGSTDYKKGFYIFNAMDLIADGEVHTLSRDLRELHDDGFIDMLVVGYRNNSVSPADLEIFELSLSPATVEQGASFPIPAYVADDMVEVKIVDSQGMPIEGARVTVDVALANFAQYAYTGKDGIAKVAAYSLGMREKAKHTLQIQKGEYVDAFVKDVRTIEVGDDGLQTVMLVRSGNLSFDVMDKATGEELSDVSVHVEVLYEDDVPKLPYELKQDWFYMTVVPEQDHHEIAFPVPSEFVKEARVYLYDDRYNTVPHNGRDVYHNKVEGGYKPYAVLSEAELHPGMVVVDGKTTNGGHVTVELDGGSCIEGVVTDWEGNPVEGARVSLYNGFCPWYPRTVTDQDGYYRLYGLDKSEPDYRVINISHDDFAPTYVDLREMKVEEITAEKYDVALGKAHTVRGIVLDDEGMPMVGAKVELDNWSKIEPTKDNQKHHICGTSIGVLNFKTKTDENGGFEFNNVSEDEYFRFGVHHSDYQSIAPILKAQDEAYVLTLYSDLKITGEVIEKGTGKAITDYKVGKGIGWEGHDRMHWQFRDRGIKKDGHEFKVVYRDTYPKMGIKIEAPGYKPGQSRIVKDGEHGVHVVIELEKGDMFSGKVVDWHGEAVKDVSVIRVDKGTQAHLGKPSFNHDKMSVKTDEAGRFAFTDTGEDFAVFATSNAGYAIAKMDEVKAGQGKEIRLNPWAEAKVKVLMDGKPLIGHLVSFDMNANYTDHDQRSYTSIRNGVLETTDEQGYVEFKALPTGKGKIRCFAKQDEGDNSLNMMFEMQVELKAGMNEFDFAYSGSRAIGRITHPDLDELPEAWQNGPMNHVIIRSKVNEEGLQPPLPKGWEDMEQDERTKWWEAFQKSDAHKAWEAKRKAAYQDVVSRQVKLEKDGRFEVYGLPADAYILQVSIYEQKEGNRYEQAASLHAQFEIKEDGGDRIDLGEFEVQVMQHVELMQKAPEFEVADLRDPEKVIRLEDYRGKWLLLDFWATWCGPCVAETPNVKAAYEALKDEGVGFEVLALSLDAKREQPLKYVEKHELPYAQGFLGDWNKDTVTKKYSVQGIPAMFLIDPEGRIVAKDLRGPEMVDVIREKMKADEK